MTERKTLINKLDMKRIGKYCQQFRTEVLKITQSELADHFGVTSRSVSMFENGKSTNVNFIYFYWQCCPTDEIKAVFLANLF